MTSKTIRLCTAVATVSIMLTAFGFAMGEVADKTGAAVEYIPPKQVEVVKPTATPTPTPVPTATPTPAPVQGESYTDAELEMLAMVIYQEAGGDAASDSTRMMVGTVVMNRVADSRFPDSIEEVLLQKQQYGRLHWTGLVWPDRAEEPGEAHAVARAYDLAQCILLGERVLPADVIWQAEFPQGTEIVAYQDGMYFCR